MVSGPSYPAPALSGCAVPWVWGAPGKCDSPSLGPVGAPDPPQLGALESPSLLLEEAEAQTAAGSAPVPRVLPCSC